MANTLQPSERMRIEDLDEHDEVRKLREAREDLERRSQRIREQAQEVGYVKPTEMGLTDPSTPLTKFCPKCGASQSHPFGDVRNSSFSRAHGVQVEIYPCGGVIIHSEREVTVSVSKTSGLGSSGQLGFTKVVLTPNQ